MTMPRGPRLDTPSAVQQVTGRGIERREIFRTEVDRRKCLARLARVASEASAEVRAWLAEPTASS